VDEFHKSCKCGLDFRRRVLVRNTLRAFLKSRCCTEGAANALLKGNRYHEGAEELLSPACDTCMVTNVGNGGWRRSKAQCDWNCCPSFNAPCMLSMLVLLQNFPNRLKFDQYSELDAIICESEPSAAKLGGGEDVIINANTMDYYSREEVNDDDDKNSNDASVPPLVAFLNAGHLNSSTDDDDVEENADRKLETIPEEDAGAGADECGIY
jgi:hypothetical protein